MNVYRNVLLRSLSLATVALLVWQAPSVAAVAISETFEGQSVGVTTPPANWTLFDTTGTPNATYTAINSSIGLPATSGVAGKVTSLDYTGSGNLPGAYIVHSTAFDPSVPFVGRFDVQIVHEASDDDITFLVGDIGSGLTRQAGDALVLKFLESASTSSSALCDGAGTPLATPPKMFNNIWYRVSFLWSPTNGSTGDFAVRAQNLSSRGVTTLSSVSDFNFVPSSVQFGFGSVNDTGAFDNISIRTNVPVLSENFESQTIATNTLPTGWTLIDAKGTMNPIHYLNVTGSNGLGGASGIAGEVNAVGSTTAYAELPSRYITSLSTFDSTQPLQGRFDVKLSSAANPGANDAIFVFGEVGSGLTYRANDAIALKLVETNSAHLANGASAILKNDTSVKIANNTWYRVEFDWRPSTESTGSTGMFSASVFDALSGNKMGNTLSTNFTFDPLLLQFGFGSLNDKVVFDNIFIIPEPSSLALLVLSVLCLGLARRRATR